MLALVVELLPVHYYYKETKRGIFHNQPYFIWLNACDRIEVAFHGHPSSIWRDGGGSGRHLLQPIKTSWLWENEAGKESSDETSSQHLCGVLRSIMDSANATQIEHIAFKDSGFVAARPHRISKWFIFDIVLVCKQIVNTPDWQWTQFGFQVDSKAED